MCNILMSRRTRKNRILRNLITLTNPATIVSCGQVRSKVVSAILEQTELYHEPEVQKADMGENICWLLLILSQIDGMDLDCEYSNTSEWWYLTLSAYMKSEKQKKLLARSINACASS